MKTNMAGAYDTYEKMYKTISNWATVSPPTEIINGEIINAEGHYFYHLGWSITDAPYYGWSYEKTNEEVEIAKRISLAWDNLMNELESAMGMYKDECADRKFLFREKNDENN